MMMCESVLLLLCFPLNSIYFLAEKRLILELCHRVDGDKVSWVPTTKKVFAIFLKTISSKTKNVFIIFLKNYFFKNQESIFLKYFFITTKNVFRVISKMISSTPLQYFSAQVYWPPAASGHTARLDSAASSHTDRGGNQHLHCHHRLII